MKTENLKKTQTYSPESFDVNAKIPPQALEAEKTFLGSILMDKDSCIDAIDSLEPEDFYDPAHISIFQAVIDLEKKGKQIDLLTITQTLRDNGKIEQVGGVYYISQLGQSIGSTAHVDSHALIIKEKSNLRKLISISSEVIKESYEPGNDVFEVLELAEKGVYEISSGIEKKPFVHVSNEINELAERIGKLKSGEITTSGISTGYRRLDDTFRGWNPSDLIILAARPGMGKTTLALDFATNCALQNKACAIFSLEMSNQQLQEKIAARISGLPQDKVKSGDLTDLEYQELLKAFDKMQNLPIFIDDTAGITPFEIRSKARKMKMKHEIEMIFIDYLQLISPTKTGKNQTRENEISNISRSLKFLAKDLNVPVMALSQLSRDVEKRGASKKPMLSDLRESGAIEQDADMVIFPYRPIYYGFDIDESGNDISKQTEVIIAKFRHGNLPKYNPKLEFDELTSRYNDGLSPVIIDNSPF